jgi:hypothetical protein
MIKSALFVLLMMVASVRGAEQKNSFAAKKDIVHVATALNHLTVFEFGEPVINAATGSATFQIEWKDNKVYVKPLKVGASTDLFIWTASRRFDYELDAPGDVKDMNFVVENPVPLSTPPIDPKIAATTHGQMEEIADMVLTQAMLGIQHVDHTTIKDAKRGITTRIEDVFQSKNTLYIRYSILNLGDRPYRVLTPRVAELSTNQAEISLRAIRRTQFDRNQVRRLGATQRNAIASASGETTKVDLKPGEQTEGVVAVRQAITGPTVLELAFGPYGEQGITATFVF